MPTRTTAQFTGACDGEHPRRREELWHRDRNLHPAVAQRQLNFGFVYASTRYRDDLVGADGRAADPALFQLPGRRLSGSNAVTLTARRRGRRRSGSAACAAWSMSTPGTRATSTPAPTSTSRRSRTGFTVVNARVGLRGPDDRWAVELWAQNLFDNDNMQVAFDAPMQGSGTIAAPSMRASSRARPSCSAPSSANRGPWA